MEAFSLDGIGEIGTHEVVNAPFGSNGKQRLKVLFFVRISGERPSLVTIQEWDDGGGCLSRTKEDLPGTGTLRGL